MTDFTLPAPDRSRFKGAKRTGFFPPESVATFKVITREEGEEILANDRRLAPYDPRLLRPEFVPNMVRLALRFLRVKSAAPVMA